MMGVGKTTVGRRLARRLGIAFADSDQEIEKAAGMTVSEIFERFGEAEFRAGERRVFARLLDDRPKVIAAGGGAFAERETRELIKQNAISIWLDADVTILLERTARRGGRPLLETGNPQETLTRLNRERTPSYSQADIHVISENGPHDTVVRDILAGLEKYKTDTTRND